MVFTTLTSFMLVLYVTGFGPTIVPGIANEAECHRLADALFNFKNTTRYYLCIEYRSGGTPVDP